MRKKNNLKQSLNLNFLDYTNLTTKHGGYDLPRVRCDRIPKFDYLATYSQPSTYFKSQNTCLSFFEYDKSFDGVQGLWNAIYYDLEERQAFFVQRFFGVKYFIAPDYTKCGDSLEIENMYRQFRSRVVSLWLTINLHAIVVPLVSTANEMGMEHMLGGLHDCRVVVFNTKNSLRDKVQLAVLKKSIEYTVNNLRDLREIVVYSSSPNIEMVRGLFRYAIERGIEIQIPDNMLQSRNRLRGEH